MVGGSSAARAPSTGTLPSMIRAGDIMIKHRHGLGMTGVAIQIGQVFSKGKSKFIHAGIACSPTEIIEMSGDGLHRNSLTGGNAIYTYDVFRCGLSGIRAGAAETAIMLYEGVRAGGFDLPYTIKGAAKSLGRGTAVSSQDRINIALDNLLAGGSKAFFCSGHVVYCYLVAMEQANIAVQGSFPLQSMQGMFGYESISYNPSYLHDHLSKNSNFGFMGTFQGCRFLRL
ncbi:hypothetical protein [Roseospira visakhapatnamensis]|uniref:Uncharacterized protein n=1 Tax=Roseospira visakhapatnamensis TaxID=390880 RepID=A0A7W6RAS5_9PROT|nr:hypothetical protein [Roseospira visakhapatnamensis]MBB4265042.1 hypothetical protein [Roseospira visakhapatnamensis]